MKKIINPWRNHPEYRSAMPFTALGLGEIRMSRMPVIILSDTIIVPELSNNSIYYIK